MAQSDMALSAVVDKQLDSAQSCKTAVLGTLVEGGPGGSLRSSRIVAVVSSTGGWECALCVYKFLGQNPLADTVYSLDFVWFINDQFSMAILNASERAAHHITDPESQVQAVKFTIKDSDDSGDLIFLFSSDQSFLYLLKEINGAVRAGFGKKEDECSWLQVYTSKICKRSSAMGFGQGSGTSTAISITCPAGGVLIDLGGDAATSSQAQATQLSTALSNTNPFATDVFGDGGASGARSSTPVDAFDAPSDWCPSQSKTGSAKEGRATSMIEHSTGSSVGVDSSTAPHSVTTASKEGGDESSTPFVRDNGEPHTVADGKRKKVFLDAAVSAMGKSPRTILKHAGKVVGSPRLNRKGVTATDKAKLNASGMPSYNRHSLLGMKMAQREESYTHKEQYRVFCGTWNVNGQLPKEGLQPWLGLDAEPPDIYAVGFQELDLSAEALLLNDSSREDDWIRAVQVGLSQRGGARYHRVKQIRLVGMLLVVYVREKHMVFVQEVESQMAGTGLMGMMGNKGGVAVRFQFHNTYICFVNCHLAAHAEEVQKRNQDYSEILSRLQFSDGKTVLDHNNAFWMGDLNYRLIGTDFIDDLAIRDMATNDKLEDLKPLDQLFEERARGNVFQGFSEGEITFRPTYKFDPGTDNWDSSEKNRPPAWCDRILWCGIDTKQLSYRSHPTLKLSDHKPVSAVFHVQISVVDVDKFRHVFEEVSREMDRLENDSIPVASLATNELVFGDIRYRQEQTKVLVVSNIGQVPMQFSFVPKLQEESYCKPWLWIKPAVGFVYPNKSVKISMTVFADTESVSELTMGTDKIEDILIFHLDGGKDYFVSITGRFVKTCFGMSLSSLLAQPLRVREVPVADLLGEGTAELGTVASVPANEQQIPKELHWLGEFILRNGMDTENLFLESGTRDQLTDLVEFLDTGRCPFTGPVNVAAEALLLFLESLPEPVIPFSLYQRSLEASNQYLLCRQVIVRLEPLSQRVFMYLIRFLKDLSKRSEKNRLDAKLIATLFGAVLIRPPKGIAAKLANSKRSQSSASKKASAFVYHFLVDR